MQPSVAVLKGMEIDEAKGRRRLQDGIERAFAHPLVCVNRSVHKRLQVLRARADEFRQRLALIVALAEEDAVRLEARARDDVRAVPADDLARFSAEVAEYTYARNTGLIL